MKETRIMFQGREYLLIGTIEKGGAIATKEQYESGECSYAHLKENGAVMRFLDTIGHRDEIKILGDVEVNFCPDISVLKILTHESWTDPNKSKR